MCAYVFTACPMAEFTEKSMIDDLEDVTDWYRLGIQLSIKSAKLDQLEEGYSRADMRKNKMLLLWFRGDTSPRREAVLITALEKIGEKVLAQKLKKKYNVFQGESIIIINITYPLSFFLSSSFQRP